MMEVASLLVVIGISTWAFSSSAMEERSKKGRSYRLGKFSPSIKTLRVLRVLGMVAVGAGALVAVVSVPAIWPYTMA